MGRAIRALTVRSQQSGELVPRDFRIAEDLAHKPGTDRLTGVERYDSRSSVGMLEEVMASFDPDYLKPGLVQSPNYVGSGRTG